MKRFLIPILIHSISSLNAAPVEIIPPSLRGAIQPQVAMDATGRTTVVFGKEESIYSVVSADGKNFGAPVEIGHVPKLALGMRRGPRIAVTGERMVVAAIAREEGNIHQWLSEDGGKNWKEGEKLNGVEGSAREGLVSLSGNGRGLVVAVWLDLRSDAMEIWSRVSRDGGKSWEADAVVYRSPDGHICECCVPNVAVSAEGKIAVMWRNWLGGSRDLYLATSDNGRDFSEARKLGTGTWPLKGCPMDGGGLVFSPDEKWTAVWRRESSVFASNAELPEKLLSANAAQAGITFAAGKPMIFWESQGSLMLQRDGGEALEFAESAKFASMAGGPLGAVITWETMIDGKKSILVDRVY